MSFRYASPLYTVEKRSRDENLLVNARPFCKLSREYAYARTNSYIREYSTTVTLIKNILRQYCQTKEKRRYMYRAIENESDVISYNKSAALQVQRRDYYLIIKLRITHNGNKLHRHD